MANNYFIKVFFIFITSRIVILFSGLISGWIYSIPKNAKEMFCQWDCGWYMKLIENGYDKIPHDHADGNAANWAFFPLFPKLINSVDLISPFSFLTSAYIINNVVFLLALYILFLYIKKEFDVKMAFITIILMSFSPYSIYFSVPYTESLFFLFLVLVFWCLINDKWIYAGLFAALLSGTRAVGVMIVFPMIIMAIKQYSFNIEFFKSEKFYKILLAILLAPIGLFVYMHYLYLHVGDAMAFSHIQIAWERELQNPLGVLYKAISSSFISYKFYSAFITILGIVLASILVFKKRYSEFIFVSLAILIPLSTSVDSMARYIFTLFPIYIVFSLLLYNHTTIRRFVYLFFVIGLVCTTFFWILNKGFMI